MGQHARLSPSNHRWPHCPGSIREERAYPNKSGEAAIDGTGSHALLELCIRTGDPNIKAAAYVGHTIGVNSEDKPEGWVVDAARAARVQIAINYIMHRDKELGGVSITPEGISNPGDMFKREDWWGTCDVTLQALENNVIEVIDYKDGFVYVDAKDNSQLIAYAIGVCYARKATGVNNLTIRMTIIQPKIEKTPIRFQEMTLEELSNRAAELNAAAILTDDPNAPLDSGEWCMWCSHKEVCPERAAKGLDGLDKMVKSDSPLFETLQAGQISVADMDTKTLAAIKDSAPIVNALLTNVDKEIETRLKAGHAVPGYAMGTGNSSKSWDDDLEMVKKKLKGMKFKNDDLYPPKFVSPAQALKKADLTDRQKKRITEELIIVKPGGAKVIKSNFKRSTPEEMFGDTLVVEAPITPVATVAPESPTESFDDLSFL